ncbi:Hypothetical predicted protein [Olea europaea subsp. europaea]|uniref:Uncharacterized protein n=1 Tax=Olea europaea subsp. europaea TaxID=158383 RepID=A0A8S0U007_OLEEU|nr:Hypothetical predicted protein [Olea europaea subsp. europaea]
MYFFSSLPMLLLLIIALMLLNCIYLKRLVWKLLAGVEVADGAVEVDGEVEADGEAEEVVVDGAVEVADGVVAATTHIAKGGRRRCPD